MHVSTFPVGPLGCNCSILADREAGEAIVVDPGGDLGAIRAELEKLRCTVSAIVHTHTHFDHVGVTAELQRATGASAKIHEADRFLYDLLPVQAALFNMRAPVRADIDGSLKDGSALRIGALELGVLHTPGHSPGSVSFVVTDGDKTTVFSGDTLFAGGIGRTDLWGGDERLILRSIRDRLLVLPETAHVIPGHGPATTIGDEKRFNPFLT